MQRVVGQHVGGGRDGRSGVDGEPAGLSPGGQPQRPDARARQVREQPPQAEDDERRRRRRPRARRSSTPSVTWRRVDLDRRRARRARRRARKPDLPPDRGDPDHDRARARAAGRRTRSKARIDAPHRRSPPACSPRSTRLVHPDGQGLDQRREPLGARRPARRRSTSSPSSVVTVTVTDRRRGRRARGQHVRSTSSAADAASRAGSPMPIVVPADDVDGSRVRTRRPSATTHEPQPEQRDDDADDGDQRRRLDAVERGRRPGRSTARRRPVRRPRGRRGPRARRARPARTASAMLHQPTRPARVAAARGEAARGLDEGHRTLAHRSGAGGGAHDVTHGDADVRRRPARPAARARDAPPPARSVVTCAAEAGQAIATSTSTRACGTGALPVHPRVAAARACARPCRRTPPGATPGTSSVT